MYLSGMSLSAGIYCKNQQGAAIRSRGLQRELTAGILMYVCMYPVPHERAAFVVLFAESHRRINAKELVEERRGGQPHPIEVVDCLKGKSSRSTCRNP